MSTQYAGDPDAYPTDFTLGDDAGPPTAAQVNVGLEALGDRTECIRTKGLMTLMRQEFLTDGSWLKPADLADDVIKIIYCGGGGGGGFGGQAGMSNGANLYDSGGAGGGGAILQEIEIDISALAVDDPVNIGLGPGGAGALVAGDSGADGDSSSVDIPALYPDGTWFARGGAGGAPGRIVNDSTQLGLARGGPPLAGTNNEKWFTPPAGSSYASMSPGLMPGQGGHAATANYGTKTTAGMDSPSWQSGTSSGGGSKGTAGTTDGTYNGGGPGGGGGGGPFGAGGQGGNGGNGNASGAGGNATNGGNAGANSGAGGGGGGGAGYGSTALGTNGHGGDGGGGRAYLYWWKKGRVLP